MEKVEWVEKALRTGSPGRWIPRALRSSFLTSVLESPFPTCSDARSCPSSRAPRKPRRPAPLCTGTSKGPERGKGLVQATQLSEAELAWGRKPQLPPVASPPPLPIFPGCPHCLLSSYGGHNDFFFLPLSLSCSAACFPLPPTSFREREIGNPVGSGSTPPGPTEPWPEPR